MSRAASSVSTGVGGAKIEDGKIDKHAIGFEPGKQIMDVNTKKTLEDIISGKALAAPSSRYRRVVASRRGSSASAARPCSGAVSSTPNAKAQTKRVVVSAMVLQSETRNGT
jgi:predicted NBD/HSP70 family sugar kinase